MADLQITDSLTDERVATCLDEMLPSVYNMILETSVLMNRLEMSSWKEERSGGARIRSPIRYGKNTSFKTFTKGTVMSPQEYPLMAYSFWNFKQGAGDVVIDWVEEREQAGSGNVINLVQERVDAVGQGIRETMNTMLWSQIIGNSGMDYNGLQFLIPADPRTGVMAGFDRALHYWWRNNYWANNANGNQFRPHPWNAGLGAPVAVGNFGSIANGYCTVFTRMGTILNNILSGEQKSSIFIVTDQLTFERYIEAAQYVNNFAIQMSNDETLVKFGFESAKFRGVDVVYDAIDAPAGYMWFVNTKYAKFISDSGAWWTWSSERQPYNQFARVRFLMLRGQFCNFQPNKHGVLQTIGAWA